MLDHFNTTSDIRFVVAHRQRSQRADPPLDAIRQAKYALYLTRGIEAAGVEIHRDDLAGRPQCEGKGEPSVSRSDVGNDCRLVNVAVL